MPIKQKPTKVYISDDRLITFRRYAMIPGPPTVDRWRGFGAEMVCWEPAN